METMTAGDVEGVDLMGVMQLETHPYPPVLIDHVTLFFFFFFFLKSVSQILPMDMMVMPLA